MQIAKKVLAVFLAALFVLPGLGGLFMVGAAGDVPEIIIVPDNANPVPNETVTYTVSIGPVSHLSKISFLLVNIPDGLTAVQLSESQINDLKNSVKNKLNCPDSEVGVGLSDLMITLYVEKCDYSSSESTELMQFQCTVDEDACGKLTIGVAEESPDFSCRYDPSLSAVTVLLPDVNFCVPEAVYLKTGDKGTQWYLNSCGEGGGRWPAPKETVGRLYFQCDGATNVTIETTGGTVSNLTKTGTDTICDDDFQISGKDGDLIQYTATYTVDGTTKVATAYTYVYEPYRVPTGCATEAQSDSHNGKYDYLGFVTALWGAQRSDLKENYSKANGADIADESIYLGNKGLVIADDRRPRNSGMVSEGKGTFGAQNDNNKNLSMQSPAAYFYVDISRFDNMNQIPNMYVGLTQTDNESTEYCKLKTYLASDYTIGMEAPKLIAPIIEETETTTETVIRQEGECTIDYDISKIVEGTASRFTVFTYGYGYSKKDGKDYVTNSYQHTHFQILNTDKGSLRRLYQQELRKNYIRQAYYYTSGWNEYVSAMENAGRVLGNPNVDYTTVRDAEDQLYYAVRDLSSVYPSVTRSTVTIDSPDGFYVYAQAATNGGAEIARVQFRAWTAANGEDDVPENWKYSPAVSGTPGAYSVNGRQYNYRYFVKTSDHNNETGEYNIEIYAYNLLEKTDYLPKEESFILSIFTATFKAEGKVVGNVQFADGMTSLGDKEPAVPEKTGYFGRWAPYSLSDRNITIEALYSLKYYPVHWVVDGKTTTTSVKYGQAIEKPADPQKEGYTFKGWTPDIPATMPASDLTFTAQFEANDYTVTWIVDGKETKAAVRCGQAIEKPADPVKEGYAFKGWTPEVPATMPAKDMTFTAQFEANDYTVTWIVDGKETKTSVRFGSAIEKPDDPVKEGYAFKGWTPDVPATMPANDLTFTAQFEANDYTVTWIVDGQETKASVRYGQAIEKPADPQKKGYTFTGWTPEVPATMPASDLTFTAQFEKNAVTLTGLTVKKAPNKTVYTYKKDANLDLAGLELEATYSDGSTQAVDPAACGITGYSPKPAGEKTITVEYEGQTAQFKVNVKLVWWQWLIRIFLLGFIWY